MTRYIETNLDDDSELVERLHQTVAEEAASNTLQVTSELNGADGWPVGCTSRAANWFQVNLAPSRQVAIAELIAEANSIEVEKGVSAFIPEVRICEIERRKLDAITSEKHQFYTPNRTKQLLDQVREKEVDYNNKLALNGGNLANEWNPFSYFAALIALAVPETWLNLQSMLVTYSKVPAVALGLTLIVGLCIAAASHVVGVSIRQQKERFGGHVSDTDRSSNRRLLAFAIILLVIVMVIVSVARFNLFSRDSDSIILQGGVVSLYDRIKVGGTILGNVAVFCLGVVVAIFAHCSVPGLGKAERSLKSIRTKWQKYYDGTLERRISSHIAAARKEIDAASQFAARHLVSHPTYKKVRAKADEILSMDAKVVGHLSHYRSELAAKASQSGASIRFFQENPYASSEGGVDELSADQFQKLRIHIWMG